MAKQGRSSEQYSNMFGPLSFPAHELHEYKSQFAGIDDEPELMKCLLCEMSYTLPDDEQEMLKHIFKEHRLVIGEVEKIASLKSYIHYWKVKFSEAPLTDFCTTLLMDSDPDGNPSKNEVYFLLSDCIAEDKTLRFEIRQSKLEWVLAQQTKERADTSFKRGCMFCRTEFSGSRSDYIDHLLQKHHLVIGKPDNLVFIDKLLDKLENNIEKLICIYCEKVFTDRAVLKEHMRKKMHKVINPNNKEYDKFYVINYLEPGRKSPQIGDLEDPTGFSSSSEDEETAWSDWTGEKEDVVCLFCPYKNCDYNVVYKHMIDEHQFNFEEVTKNYDFYQRVKIVNYIRRQINVQKKCVFCDEAAKNLKEHMTRLLHYKLPEQQVWEQPEYYFPTYENDAFLYNLDVSSDESDNDNNEIAVGIGYLTIKINRLQE